MMLLRLVALEVTRSPGFCLQIRLQAGARRVGYSREGVRETSSAVRRVQGKDDIGLTSMQSS